MNITRKMNLSPFLGRIILFCVVAFVVNCNNSEILHTTTDFSGGWQNISTNHPGPKSTFIKQFNLEINPEKIYIFRLMSPKEITNIKVNNAVVYGNPKPDFTEFNIGAYLKEKNSFELSINKDFSKSIIAEFVCLNKVFFSGVSSELSDDKIRVDISLKNNFTTEVQGKIDYKIIGKKRKPVVEKEWPVFLNGNSESHFRHELNLDSNEWGNNLVLECEFANSENTFDRLQIPLSNHPKAQIINNVTQE